MAWAARMGLAALAVVILGAGALAWYASTLKPPRLAYHIVFSDDQFPK